MVGAGLLALVFALGGIGRSGFPQSFSFASGGPSAGEERALEASSRLPLSFVPSLGGGFQAEGQGFRFSIRSREIGLSFAKGGRAASLVLQPVGPSAEAKLEARNTLPGKVNYLIGSDPSKWRTGLPTYGELVYHELWPGIDMVIRGQGGTLKYEFVLRAGARAQDIALAYSGAKGLPSTLEALSSSRPASGRYGTPDPSRTSTSVDGECRWRADIA